MANANARPTLLVIRRECHDFHHELYALQQSNTLTDFILRVGGKKIECHKVVLAAGSPYFRGLLRSGMQESQLGESELKNLSFDTLEAIVKYFYLREIAVEYDHMKDCIEAAEFLQLPDLKNECATYLLTELDVDNALGWSRFCKMFGMDQVVQEAKKILTKNFCGVADSYEFKCLDFSELVDYVFTRDICVQNQYSILNACLDWIKADIDDRKKHTLDILARVNFEKNSDDILKYLIREYSDVLDDNVNFIYARYFEDTLSCGDIEQKKKSDELSDYLLLLGEENTPCEPNSTMQLCDTNDFQWKKFPGAFPTKHPILFSNGCRVKDGIFLCVNEIMQHRHKAVYSTFLFHLQYNSWVTLPERLDVRSWFSSVSLSDFVFLCGGKNATTWSNDLEMFNFGKNKWCHVAGLPNPPGNEPIVTVVNACLYIITNTCDSSIEVVQNHGNVMQVYDVIKEKMTISYLPEMLVPTYGKVAFACKDYMYLVGGIQQDCHRYCTKLNSWSTLKPPLKVLCYPACAVSNRKAIFLGGATDEGIEDLSDEVVEFDLESEEWKTLDWKCPAPMMQGLVTVVTKQQGFIEELSKKYSKTNY